MLTVLHSDFYSFQSQTAKHLKANAGKKTFEVFTTTKIYKRFDNSHEFWNNFSASKENERKKLGYFEIEHIDNLCILTIAANPKEYFDMFED